MEENEVDIERNLINSIGNNEEITEPHVKLIISAFDGKKLSREDIDKFKQLETTFRKIASLKDGDNILKNITGDIRDAIVSGAYYQENSGTVSLGLIAADVIKRAEKAYIEGVESSKKEDEKATVADAINESQKVKEEIKAWHEEYGLAPEEVKKFEKDLFALMRGIGIDLSEEEEKDLSEYLRDARRRADDPNDEKAREIVSSEKEFSKKKDRESGLRYVDAIISDIKVQIASKKAILESDKMSSQMKKDAKKELDELEPKLEKLLTAREKIARGDVAQMLGATEEEIRQFSVVEDRMEQLKKEKKQNTEEYAELEIQKKYLLQVHDVQEMKDEIARLESLYERASIARERKNREISKGDLENIKQRIAVLKSQIKSINGLVNDNTEYEMETFESESIEKHEENDGRRNNNKVALRKAAELAKAMNDKYLANDGEIGFVERQAFYSGGKANLFQDKSVDEEATEAIVKKYADKMNLQHRSMSTYKSELQKISGYTRINFYRQSMTKELSKLNVSKEYITAIADRVILEATGLKPIEYQTINWQIAAVRLKKSGAPEDKIKRIEEISKRIEKNQNVYDDIATAIKGDKQNLKIYKLLINAIEKTSHGDSAKYKALVASSTEEEAMNIVQERFNAEFGNDPQYDENVKKRYLDIMQQIYSKNGKDGLLAICESGIAARMTFTELRREIHKDNVIARTREVAKLKNKTVDLKIAGENGNSITEGLPRFLVEDTGIYFEMMITLRRRGLSEEKISNTLIQLDPSAARNAYALYELGLNKERLLSEETPESEKAELRRRNKDLVKMMHDQYFKKHLRIQRECDALLKEETDPVKIEQINSKRQRSVEVLIEASQQILEFDIEKNDFEIPDELVKITSGRFKGRFNKRLLQKNVKGNEEQEIEQETPNDIDSKKVKDSDMDLLMSQEGIDIDTGDRTTRTEQTEVDSSIDENGTGETKKFTLDDIRRAVGAKLKVGRNVGEQVEIITKAAMEQSVDKETHESRESAPTDEKSGQNGSTESSKDKEVEK